ncbi:MAG: DNA cytosine methyltransferase, partial [Geitlerinemataceae cyanobacterium]
MRPIGVDLFAGAGGLSLGFEQAGFDVLAAVEIDPVHCAVHEYNFPHCATICQSVTEITGKEIRSKSKIGDNPIDVVFGGPPCQGFSLMGKRLLDDPRNTLVSHFIRLIDELQPKYFVMENVKGMAIGNHKQFLSEAIDKFDYYGYKVLQPYQVLNAACYGVPQNRERLFLIGVQKELPFPEYPKPIYKPAGSVKKIDKKYEKLPDSPTVLDALKDLPNADRYSKLNQQDCVKVKEEEFKTPSDYVRDLHRVGEGNYSYPRKYDPHLLTSSLRTQHTKESIRRFENTLPGETEPISRFLKLNPNGICNTLRAGTPSSRGAYTSPRPIHYKFDRCITVREAARLHSYPDWFRFHVTKWHGCRQIGNSVPPLLGRAVATEIIKVLEMNPTIPEEILQLGETKLLSMTMAEAAKRYGVPADTIPQRSRKSQSKVDD